MRVDKKRLDAYLERIHGTTCPLCGNIHWEIADTIFQAIEFDHKGILINGSSFPMVPLTCINCGNTYFINALVSKLIDPEEQTQNINTISNEKSSGECDE